MPARGMSAEDDFLAKILVDPVDASAHLGDHLGKRHGGKQGEVERHVCRAGPDDRLGGEGVLAARLALPGAAVHEHERLLALSVDVESLARTRSVVLGSGLPQPCAHPVALDAVALDDLVGVRHPGALLVLIVERLLVVVAENLLQNRIAMPSSSPSEFTRSTRLWAILKLSPARRSRCSTRAPQTRCFSCRHSTRWRVDAT